MEKELKNLINLLVDKQQHVLLLFWAGKVFLLHNHHRWVDGEDATKVWLGNAPASTIHIHSRASNRIPGARVLYLTEKM